MRLVTKAVLSRALLLAVGSGVLTFLWNFPGWMGWDDSTSGNWLQVEARSNCTGNVTASALGNILP